MFAYGAVTFPNGIGHYLAGERLFGETVRDFFGNCSWVLSNTSEPFGCTQAQLGVWSDEGRSPAMNVLTLFFVSSVSSGIWKYILLEIKKFLVYFHHHLFDPSNSAGCFRAILRHWGFHWARVRRSVVNVNATPSQHYISRNLCRSWSGRVLFRCNTFSVGGRDFVWSHGTTPLHHPNLGWFLDLILMTFN